MQVCESEKIKLFNNYSSRLNGQLVLILIACNRGVRLNTLKSKTKLTNLEIFNVSSLSDLKFKEGFANLTRLILTVSSTMEIEKQPLLGKRLWSFIKHSSPGKRGIPTLKWGNSVVSDAKDKAELLTF